LPKRNVLNKVVGFTGNKFTLLQFALYTYAQNVVQSFAASKNLHKADADAYLKRLSA
jgi:hypothetical protein